MDRAEETRQQIADAGYRCIARWGVSRTTMADLAREAGVSRATLYRYFPGGREEVFAQSINDAVVAFFSDLLVAVEGASSLEEMLEIGLPRAHRKVEEHDVLQAVLRNEPEALHPALDDAVDAIRAQMAEFLTSQLEAFGVAPGVSIPEAADYLARMLLSYMGSPGRWNLADPGEVSTLVRAELLGGIRPS